MSVCERSALGDVWGNHIIIATTPADVTRCMSMAQSPPEKRPLESLEPAVTLPQVKRRRLAEESSKSLISYGLEVCVNIQKLKDCGSIAGRKYQCKLHRNPKEGDDKAKFDKTLKLARQIYEDIWANFLTNRYWQGEEKASELAEVEVSEQYEKACNAFMELLPWVKSERCKEMGDGSTNYTMLQFQGSRSKQRDLFRALEHLREESTQGQAREALCAILAVLSSRKEKTWLDGIETETALKEELKWQRNKPDKLREEVSDFLSRKVRGYFARKLVDPRAIFRIALASNTVGLRPASLMVTYHLPLQDAFKRMDDEGPLEDRPCSWFLKASRQFALQDISKGVKQGDKNERKHAWKLKPEPKIKELLCGRKPVVFLDALAALAPRKLAKEQKLSNIVQLELAALLHQAKAQGQAVVFMLGGKESHKLAEKVYLQPPFTDTGLRCGYLRWRESPWQPWARSNAPWAREKLRYEYRMCIGLQLP